MAAMAVTECACRAAAPAARALRRRAPARPCSPACSPPARRSCCSTSRPRIWTRRTRWRWCGWLRRLATTHTVVSVLHDLPLALHADRLLVLRAGAVQAQGVCDDPALHAALTANLRRRGADRKPARAADRAAAPRRPPHPCRLMRRRPKRLPAGPPAHAAAVRLPCAPATAHGRRTATRGLPLRIRAHGCGKPLRSCRFMKPPGERCGEHRAFEPLAAARRRNSSSRPAWRAG